jgi:hypothetical protein
MAFYCLLTADGWLENARGHASVWASAKSERQAETRTAQLLVNAVTENLKYWDWTCPVTRLIGT